MRYRENKDGSIFFPSGGPVPDCPQGYIPDPTNPFKFLPQISECFFRTIRKEDLPCGCGQRNMMHCEQLNLPVGPNGCQRCQNVPGWLEEMKSRAN